MSKHTTGICRCGRAVRIPVDVVEAGHQAICADCFAKDQNKKFWELVYNRK